MNEFTASGFLKILTDKFPHVPTTKQGLALNMLANFVLGNKKDNVFLLKGFAGTGKTTLVATLVSSLLICLVTIGLVFLIDRFLPQKIKPVLVILFGILSIYLGYKIYDSINAPIEFNKVKTERFTHIS